MILFILCDTFGFVKDLMLRIILSIIMSGAMGQSVTYIAAWDLNIKH